MKLLSFTCIACVLMHFRAHATMRSSYFKAGVICQVRERMTRGCSKREQTDSSVYCASLCLVSDLCEGFSLDLDSSECFLHDYCGSWIENFCLPEDKDFENFIRFPAKDGCLNGGVWIEATGDCLCSRSFVGVRCERRPESCPEFLSYTFSDQVVKTRLKNYSTGRVFSSYCLRSERKLMTYLAYYNGDANFNHSWGEFVSGFADNGTSIHNFWLGLEHLRYINANSPRQDLIINVTLTSPNSDTSIFITVYFDFRIGDSQSYFNYSYSGMDTMKTGPLSLTNDVGNCLGPPQGVAFSTPDTDHDQDLRNNVNCASIAQSGWWFLQCYPVHDCNLFGLPPSAPPGAPTPVYMKLNAFDMHLLRDHGVTVEVVLQESPVQ